MSPGQRHGAGVWGNLSIREAPIKQLGRHGLVAEVRLGERVEVHMTLIDARLKALTMDGIYLQGYEVLAGRTGYEHAVAQEWWIDLFSSARRVVRAGDTRQPT